MKHIKYFENIKDKPQVGDYVICNENDTRDELKDFVNNNIGKIVEIGPVRYYIVYENVPESIKNDFDLSYNYDNCRYMLRYEIIHFSPDKTDLEAILKAKKYNL